MEIFQPEYKQYVAERIRLQTSEATPLKAMISRGEFSQYRDEMRRSIIVNFTTYIHGMTKERVTVHEKWPRTWWDAFKERWFPQWAIARWPVEYRRIDIDQPIYLAVCPHLEDKPQRTHLEWMAAQWDAAVKPKEEA